MSGHGHIVGHWTMYFLLLFLSLGGCAFFLKFFAHETTWEERFAIWSSFALVWSIIAAALIGFEG